MEMMVGQAHGSNYSHSNVIVDSSHKSQFIQPLAQHMTKNLQLMSRKISGIQQCLSGQNAEKQHKDWYCKSLQELVKMAGKCVTTEHPTFEQLSIGCLSLISICLFKGGRQAIGKKQGLKKQLLNVVFSCDVDRLLKKSQRVQVALVYLLEVVRPFTPQQNMKRLVQISMQLLRQSSSSLKMNYNLFKLLVQLLPNIDIPTAIRFKVVSSIVERSQKHSSPDIQSFVYRILLHFEQYAMFTQLFQKNLETSINKQQIVATAVQEMIRIKHQIDSQTIQKAQTIIQKYVQLPIAFYQLVQVAVTRYDAQMLVDWLEGGTLKQLGTNWEAIVNQQQQHTYFSLINSVLKKCEGLNLDRMVLYQCDTWNFSGQYREAVSNCRCPKMYKVLRELFFGRMKQHLHQF